MKVFELLEVYVLSLFSVIVRACDTSVLFSWSTVF